MRYKINHTPGRKVLINDQEWLYFSGTSYLGMSKDFNFSQLVKEGIDRYGHFGGSRLSNIQIDIFEEAEKYLEKISGAEKAMVVSSGTLAGQFILMTLRDTECIFYAPDLHPALHPSLLHKATKVDHGWQKNILAIVREANAKNITILCNAIDPLFLKPSDFDWVNELPKDIKISLIIDDSHKIGISGKNGGGTYSELQIPGNIKLTVIASLGKAFGIPAGVILGDRDFMKNLIPLKHIGGASPPSPAYLYAFLNAEPLYHSALKKLRTNIDFFDSQIGESGLFKSLPDFPVYYTPDSHLANFLENHQILISSFPYPDAESDPISRIVLNSLHQKEDLEQLINLVGQYFKNKT